ncbi:uncharacterized protein F5891DRAFT_1061490 [Suillus fuscotomentosus]|uniref:Uncharacterized protein n=1 Tax=Suillus fuscotomentosus TaxID=1912939 RepID=A0AAD4DVK5_9AGAM|nr:uncharacterized protein F5891DRAFT_1061490 [Suillus fuscotomentosus]KAG1894757.1 hypothetical protein F5891DRAFT_1061490 [Suillus fuscotomentosus]
MTTSTMLTIDLWTITTFLVLFYLGLARVIAVQLRTVTAGLEFSRTNSAFLIGWHDSQGADTDIWAIKSSQMQ